jgi:hypothetical protein
MLSEWERSYLEKFAQLLEKLPLLKKKILTNLLGMVV